MALPINRRTHASPQGMRLYTERRSYCCEKSDKRCKEISGEGRNLGCLKPQNFNQRDWEEFMTLIFKDGYKHMKMEVRLKTITCRIE